MPDTLVEMGMVLGMFLPWVIASFVMVVGYFIAEAYVMGIGPVFAATEVSGNIFLVFGGIFSIFLSRLLRKRFNLLIL
ncbi:hypothetical protein KAX03_01620 [Candidatus Bathyarchaeota archaeon]|nr:hypothetical protein [Candidatus Bathyarchaeota archaeon]